MGRVWDTEIPGNLKLLLLAYADAAEHDGTEIWPGRKRIAIMCGVSVATADRLTRKLLEGGYLIQVQKGHRGQRAAYLIPLDMVGNAYQDDTQRDATTQDDSLSTGTDSLSTGAGKPIIPDTPPVLDPSSTPVLQDAPAAGGLDGLSVIEEERLAARQRNLHWDALVDLFGEPAANQRALYGRLVATVKAGGWGDAEFDRRAAYLATLWGPEKVTVASLEKHWSRIESKIGSATSDEVTAYTEAYRRGVTIARLTDE